MSGRTFSSRFSDCVEIFVSPTSIIHAEHDKLNSIGAGARRGGGSSKGESFIDEWEKRNSFLTLKWKMKINFDFDFDAKNTHKNDDLFINKGEESEWRRQLHVPRRP